MFCVFVALASCSKSNEGHSASPQGDVTQATFHIESPATRSATPNLTRYIIEAYEDTDLTATPQRVEGITGNLTLTLKRSTEYTFLFWADGGTTSASYYDASDLRAVRVRPTNLTQPGQRAYCFATSFNSNDFERNREVKLRNAVAEVNFIETKGLATPDNTLKAIYPTNLKFNVADGKATEVAKEAVTHTFTNIDGQTKGSIIATDYVFASQSEKTLTNIKVQVNAEPQKKINNVPMRCNFKTNIRGEYGDMYALTFTISDELADYETSPNEPVDHPATKTITIKGVDFDFILVKKGTFLMGTPGAIHPNVERPYWVQLTKDYYMSRTEVTQEQYIAIMNNNPSYFNGDPDIHVHPSKYPYPGEVQEKRPVESAAWITICSGTVGKVTVAPEECFLYKITEAAALGEGWTFRLPSEAQWEYAARGGHLQPGYMRWPGTDNPEDSYNYAWYSDNTQNSGTHQVGLKIPNALGLYDMVGNVDEFCSNSYTWYPDNPNINTPAIDPDPDRPDIIYRSARGGDRGRTPETCNIATRYGYELDEINRYGPWAGIRLVLVPPAR